MTTPAEQVNREAELAGIGCSRKRKEDPRFIQGKGNYVDGANIAGFLKVADSMLDQGVV